MVHIPYRTDEYIYIIYYTQYTTFLRSISLLLPHPIPSHKSLTHGSHWTNASSSFDTVCTIIQEAATIWMDTLLATW